LADLSLAKASAWTTASTIIKIAAGLLIVKMLALTFGPAGVGLAGNFRQMVTVLGLLAGAGIFNGVTKYVAQYQENPAQLKIVIGTSAAIVLGFSTLFGVLLIVGAQPISVALFGKSDYQL
jgi:antigen flippase